MLDRASPASATPPPPSAWGLTGVTIRTALLVGFGLTLGVWLFAGYYFTSRVIDVEDRSAVINARYTRAQELLSSVREQVLLESVFVRDALLDPDPASRPAYRRLLESTYHAATEALDQCVAVLDSPVESERINELRREIETFHSAMVEVVAPDGRYSAADVRTILNDQVVPRRALAMRVSEAVQALILGALVQQQDEIVEVRRETESRVWEGLGVVLTLSFAIGLTATLYAGHLERQVRGQQAKDAENARNVRELSAKLINAQEEERRSIARELHDEVGQVLTAIKVELAVAQRVIDTGGGGVGLLDDVRAIADGAISTVRDLSRLLYPPMLDDLGLPAALEWYARGFSKRHGIRVDLIHQGMTDRQLIPETAAAAYRIVQEALTNVAKHAHATTSRVFLEQVSNTMRISVTDDGVGFDQTGAGTSGLGLVGIRDRVARLGGSVCIESSPGNGTTLTVEFLTHARDDVGDHEKTVEPPQPMTDQVALRHT